MGDVGVISRVLVSETELRTFTSGPLISFCSQPLPGWTLQRPIRLNTAQSIERSVGSHREPRDRTSHWGKAAMPKNSKPTGVWSLKLQGSFQVPNACGVGAVGVIRIVSAVLELTLASPEAEFLQVEATFMVGQ